MFSNLNKQIQSQWAFFGPKWLCWFLVLLGSIPWFIEGPFKVLGYGEFGPGYQTIEYITSVLHAGNHSHQYGLIC